MRRYHSKGNRTTVQLGRAATVVTHMSPEPPTLPVVHGQCLPMAREEPSERADAARNREKVLAAAEMLFAERGPENVSMHDVAKAAGVGKGTLFRRFGDRATLARAVLSERERRFQDSVIRGAPPLGPGAPPVERLVAFGNEYMEFSETHVDLLLAAESDPRGWRLRSGPYAMYVTHVTLLIREIDPELDAEYTAATLLNMLNADMVRYLRRERAMNCARMHAGWEGLVRRLVTPAC
jgi:AcrR family transcriptional regulator